MKALVLAGGTLLPTPHVRALCAGADLVVAADSGLRHARTLALEPLAVVGDFDSVAQADLEAFPGIPHLRHPVRKDRLDLELAIDLVIGRGAREIIVLGAFGSRFDQSLAALLIGARLHGEGIGISLHDGERDAFPVGAGHVLSLELEPATVFSLLALKDSCCSVSGAEYPLDSAALPFGVGLGLANRATDGPRIEVHAGLLAVIVERNVT